MGRVLKIYPTFAFTASIGGVTAMKALTGSILDATVLPVVAWEESFRLLAEPCLNGASEIDSFAACSLLLGLLSRVERLTAAGPVDFL